MRFTLISDDKMVYVDGVAKVVSTPMPPGIHAVQWYGTYGEVEYIGNGARPNERITSLADYQKYIDAWNNA